MANRKRNRAKQQPEERTSPLDVRISDVRIPALASLNTRSKNYQQQVEKAYVLCMKELTRSHEDIQATCEQAETRLETLARELSRNLGVEISVSMDDASHDSSHKSIDARALLNPCVNVGTTEKTILKTVLTHFYNTLKPYIEHAQTLYENSLAFREHAYQFYGALLELTQIEPLNTPASTCAIAQAYIIHDGTIIVAMINAKEGACLTHYLLHDALNTQQNKIPQQNRTRRPTDTPLEPPAPWLDLYLVENPSPLIEIEDLLCFTMGAISTRYHQTLTQNFPQPSDVEIEKALAEQGIPKNALGRPLFEDTRAVYNKPRQKNVS